MTLLSKFMFYGKTIISQSATQMLQLDTD